MIIQVLLLVLTSTGMDFESRDEPSKNADRQEVIDAQKLAPDEQSRVIEVLQAEVQMLRSELAKSLNDRDTWEQPGRVPVHDVDSVAIGNAIFELSDCEQQLISGDEQGVEDRLFRAQQVLDATAATEVAAARIALARGDRGNARASLAKAIAAAKQSY